MSPQQHKELTDSKERLLVGAIEEIEGRVYANREIREFCFIEQKEGRPCEEVVYWRLKPILHFKWLARNGELKHLKLYSPPPAAKE